MRLTSIIGLSGLVSESRPALVMAAQAALPVAIVGLFFAFLAVALVFWVFSLRKKLDVSREENQGLIKERDMAKQETENVRKETETQVEERTIGVVKLNEQLNKQIKDLKGDKQKQQDLVKELKDFLEVKSAGAFLPICSNCKDIRDENGYWHSIEDFIQNLSDSDFSHTLCPDCTKELYPELFEGGAKPFCLSWKPGTRERDD